MTRRRIAFAMAMALCVGALSGCGDTVETAENNEGTEQKAESGQVSMGSSVFNGELEKNVTIQVLENDTAISKGYFKELIQAFNEAYAEYGITAVDANMDQYLDLANDGPYGYGPDVLYQANDIIMQYATGKHIYPLPIEQLECYDSIPQIAWDAYKTEVDGTVYYCGVPVNVQAPMLYYRTDLLPDDWETTWDNDGDKVPDMVENWNDMYAYSVARHEEDAGKYGYMKSLNDGYFASGYYFSYGGYVFGGEEKNDTFDIGFSKGEAEKGGRIIRQLASIMNLECTEDTITKNSYSRLGNGTYFATMTTPDVYSLFIKEMKENYKKDGLSEEEAYQKAVDNLVVCDVPSVPNSGDLEDDSQGHKKMTVMGGINGYAISSYTKYPNAALKFVNFATSYNMIKKRCEILGISPARVDLANEFGGLNQIINDNLESGSIYVMPSIRELAQVWKPLQTFCATLCDDVLKGKEVYSTLEKIKEGLKNVDQQIYDAIHTLSS